MKSVKVVLSTEAEEAYNYLSQQAKDSKIERSILNPVKEYFIMPINCQVINVRLKIIW